MGKGDKKTGKGKIAMGSYGKHRARLAPPAKNRLRQYLKKKSSVSPFAPANGSFASVFLQYMKHYFFKIR